MSPQRIAKAKRLYRHYVQKGWSFKARDVECPVCGTVQNTGRIRRGEQCECHKCGHVLVRTEFYPLKITINYCVASLIVFFIAMVMPFMSMRMPAAAQSMSILSTFRDLIHLDYGFLADTLFVLVFMTPLVFILLTLYVYTAIQHSIMRPFMTTFAKWIFIMEPWIMADIFFFGALVSIVKITAIGSLELGWGFYALFIYSFLVMRIALSTNQYWLFDQIAQLQERRLLDDPTTLEEKIAMRRMKEARESMRERPEPSDFWDGDEEIREMDAKKEVYCHRCMRRERSGGSFCSFCFSRIDRTRHQKLQTVWAFLITGILLYIPANYYPIMITENPTLYLPTQILEGILVLWRDGDRFVASIIFFASIVIPFFKMFALLFLLYQVHFGLLFSPKAMTRLHHFIEWIGKWSMIDVFVIIILMSLFRTPVAKVTPAPAVVYFALVVFSTMIAANLFDTKWLWQREGEFERRREAKRRLKEIRRNAKRREESEAPGA